MLKYNYARYNNRLLSSAFRENVRHCYVFRIRDISVTYGIVGQGGNRWDVRYYNQIKRDIQEENCEQSGQKLTRNGILRPSPLNVAQYMLGGGRFELFDNVRSDVIDHWLLFTLPQIRVCYPFIYSYFQCEAQRTVKVLDSGFLIMASQARIFVLQRLGLRFENNGAVSVSLGLGLYHSISLSLSALHLC